MTKGELRKARKAARAEGAKLTGELALERPSEGPAVEWSESAAGYRARDKWARAYDRLNGAPEGPWDY